jgi:hypothetical protein
LAITGTWAPLTGASVSTVAAVGALPKNGATASPGSVVSQKRVKVPESDEIALLDGNPRGIGADPGDVDDARFGFPDHGVAVRPGRPQHQQLLDEGISQFGFFFGAQFGFFFQPELGLFFRPEFGEVDVQLPFGDDTGDRRGDGQRAGRPVGDGDEALERGEAVGGAGAAEFGRGRCRRDPDECTQGKGRRERDGQAHLHFTPWTTDDMWAPL